MSDMSSAVLPSNILPTISCI